MPTAQQRFVKETTPFKVHKSRFAVLEPPLEQLHGFLTPNEHFFVLSEVGTARVDVQEYRLQIQGDAVDKSIVLTYDDLLSLPSRTLPAYLECAGNQRRLFTQEMGRTAGDVQWSLGGIGMAEWTGVALRDVLALAGLHSAAAHVNIKGLDSDAPEGGINKPLTIEKALDPDTLLVYLMNGEILPADHGFPIRALAPGWVGANSVKWVGSITVSRQKMWVNRNTREYVYIGPQWPPSRYAPARGAPIEEQNIRSSLALPWPATLPAGRQTIQGIARAASARVAAVEWSADGGAEWHAATLLEPVLKYAWARFEFQWEARPGPQTLMTRATDEHGNSQPDTIPFNEGGYMFNMIHAHPVTVVGG